MGLSVGMDMGDIQPFFTYGSVAATGSKSEASSSITGMELGLTYALGGGNTTLTITYLPANQGEFTTAVTCTVTCDDGSANATTFAVTHTTAGTATENWEYIDNDAAANTIIVSNAYEYATSAGAAATTETYHVITYDSTDVFIIDATDGDVATAAAKVGASEAEFETEMASLTALATDISGTEVEGALTSGISVWKIGA